MENRHAYLIMAHGDFKLLKKLLVLLDDMRNDIYIHVDRKVKNFIVDEYRELVKEQGIRFMQISAPKRKLPASKPLPGGSFLLLPSLSLTLPGKTAHPKPPACCAARCPFNGTRPA